MHRCRTDTYQNEHRGAWERIFYLLVKKQTQVDPPKVPQTIDFKLFGTFERVFGVEGGGRPARTHTRTDARTDARSAPHPPPQLSLF